MPADKTITVYRCGPLVDLCRGPHIPNTSFVKAFSCLKVKDYVVLGDLEKLFICWQLFISFCVCAFWDQASSAYWRGNKDRESLQRVYGISFTDQKRLKVISVFALFSSEAAVFLYPIWCYVMSFVIIINLMVLFCSNTRMTWKKQRSMIIGNWLRSRSFSFFTHSGRRIMFYVIVLYLSMLSSIPFWYVLLEFQSGKLFFPSTWCSCLQ